MSYDKEAKKLIERFLQVTQNYERARLCALAYIDLNLEDLNKETFQGSYTKLRIHELKKLKSLI
jgi:cell fate (sporulation/competence/biofilm development) regulator YlbF (YheA/YmcA/DUF963 family)